MTSKRKLLALALAAPLAALAGWVPPPRRPSSSGRTSTRSAEPYHTEAVWAAEEIKKRTNGKYEIQVFPASQLGNENQINEALGLGTVDMIYTGVAFAGRIHKPVAITNAPYVLRDFDHWKAYRDSPAVPRHRQGLRGQDQAQGRVPHLLRPAHGHGQQGDQEAGGHEGHEAARAAGAAVPHVHEVGRRQRHADRLRRGLPGAAAGHGRRPGEPAADHHGQEVLRGAEPHHADRPHHRIAAGDRRQARVAKLSRRREEDLRRGADPGRRQGDGRDPRVRAEAGRRVREARQERGRGRPRGLPRRGACRCTTTAAAAGPRSNTTRCRR